MTKTFQNLEEALAYREVVRYAYPYQNTPSGYPLSPHLKALEKESVEILREAVAEGENPVMLYSIGKDSGVMLHLAQKAFYPENIPFPLLHVDTGWKFEEMYDFRDWISKEKKINLIIYKNQEGIKNKINPFDHGAGIHTMIMKTEALKKALNEYKFDMIFGGARRDEDPARSKERIFSLRNSDHQWMQKSQRPELWNTYSLKKIKERVLEYFLYPIGRK